MTYVKKLKYRKISDKFSIRIPFELVKKFGIKEGDLIEFIKCKGADIGINLVKKEG